MLLVHDSLANSGSPCVVRILHTRRESWRVKQGIRLRVNLNIAAFPCSLISETGTRGSLSASQPIQYMYPIIINMLLTTAASVHDCHQSHILFLYTHYKRIQSCRHCSHTACHTGVAFHEPSYVILALPARLGHGLNATGLSPRLQPDLEQRVEGNNGLRSNSGEGRPPNLQ